MRGINSQSVDSSKPAVSRSNTNVSTRSEVDAPKEVKGMIMIMCIVVASL